jgi:hypothetical protein
MLVLMEVREFQPARGCEPGSAIEEEFQDCPFAVIKNRLAHREERMAIYLAPGDSNLGRAARSKDRLSMSHASVWK